MRGRGTFWRIAATLALIANAPSSFGAAIAAAILPDSRSAVVGSPVTIFASIVSLGDAQDCSISPISNPGFEFHYQTTSSATNGLTGTIDTPADIPDGGAQSFVLSFTPTQTFDQMMITFDFSCTNASSAPISSVNTLLLSGSTEPVADVIAVAAVASNDGTVGFVADNNPAAFAVAAINVGAEDTVMVDLQKPSALDRLTVRGCRTDSAGLCTDPPSPSPLPFQSTLGAVPATFSFFVNTLDWIRFDPAVNRLRVVFEDGDSVVRGSTSLAARARATAPIDQEITGFIETLGLTGDPTRGRNLPSINDPLAQLGKLLFFSKSLGGEFDSACASCHHPALAGGDGLSLPIGAGAVDADVIGPGRAHPTGGPNVGRNSPTVFNSGLFDRGLFWDSRIESLVGLAGQGGAGAGIRTPDTGLGQADANAGTTLLQAQARFPFTVVEEMRGNFMPGATGDQLRDALAARLGDYGSGAGILTPNNWLAEFQAAFGSSADATELITVENITLAIAEYQRSMVFVDNDWKRYVDGRLDALDSAAKDGAVLFFKSADQGGAGCARCHSGDLFTDEKHHVLAAPQIGPGKGDPNAADFGREQQTGNNDDRFKFRTPTLLNVELTGPYFHSGGYDRLGTVLEHYGLPEDTVLGYFATEDYCDLRQFESANCSTLFPNARTNTVSALQDLVARQSADPDSTIPDISDLPFQITGPLFAFLRALTDSCAAERDCLSPWIPEPGEAPDAHQLNATDALGAPL